MTCEIDKDFYCTNAEDFISSDGTEVRCDTDHFCETCKNMRRKWPTPSQFMEEWGVEWNGAIYTKCTFPQNPPEKPEDPCLAEFRKNYCSVCRSSKWISSNPRSCALSVFETVCACTPWDKPDDDWRPS